MFKRKSEFGKCMQCFSNIIYECNWLEDDLEAFAEYSDLFDKRENITSRR